MDQVWSTDRTELARRNQEVSYLITCTAFATLEVDRAGQGRPRGFQNLTNAVAVLKGYQERAGELEYIWATRPYLALGCALREIGGVSSSRMVREELVRYLGKFVARAERVIVGGADKKLHRDLAILNRHLLREENRPALGEPVAGLVAA